MKIRILTFLCASMLLASSAPAALIAYWDQNSNALPGGGFGFVPADFPQPADQGAGTITLANFDTTTGGVDGAYTSIASFGGDLLNAQPSIPFGGSLSPTGATGTANNGMSILMNVSTAGYEDIQVSWAQRGTTTGFSGRQFAYSTDGVNFTDLGTDTGALTATWVLKTYDFSSITAVDNQAAVTFRITLTGATNATGNNRFDNLTVTGTPTIPEPGTAVLAMLSLAAAGAVSMRSRLG
jgi:hypothetical protein